MENDDKAENVSNCRSNILWLILTALLPLAIACGLAMCSVMNSNIAMLLCGAAAIPYLICIKHIQSGPKSRSERCPNGECEVGPTGDNKPSFLSLLSFWGVMELFFILGAPVGEYQFTQEFLESRASSDWPSVTGMLINLQVIETTGRNGIHNPAIKAVADCIKSYHAEVAYSYRVGNGNFHGSRIRTDNDQYSNRNDAIQAVGGLTVGQPVPVFYNPSDPRQSVLRPGIRSQNYAFLYVPVLMLGFGTIISWISWCVRRQA